MAARNGPAMARGRGNGTAVSGKEPTIDLVLELDTTRPAKTEPKDVKSGAPDSPLTSTAASYRGATTGLAAPTSDYLMALRMEKQRDYGEQDQQIDEMRRVRTLSNKVQMPDGLSFVDMEVRDPTITDEIQRVVAALTLNRPKLSIKAAREGESAEKNQTLRKNATEAILWQAATRIAGRNTFREAVDCATGDGGAWTKFLFLRDTYEARYALRKKDFTDADDFNDAVEDAKKAAGVPFVWQNVDPRNIYPTWSMGKLTEVLEVSQRPLHQALRQYRLGIDKQGRIVPEAMGLPMNEVQRKPGATVLFLEHWDAEFCTYMIEGSYGDRTIVKQFRHRYGRVPYFFAPGFIFPWMQNVKVGWGIAQSKRWLIEYKSFLLTLHAQQAARDTFAPFYRTIEPKGQQIMGRKGQPLASEKYKLGQIVNGPPGSTLNSFPFPTNSTALKEQIAFVSEMIDRLLTPRVTAEIGSGLEGAGFAMNQVLSEARIYQDPIAQAIAAMLEEITRFLWHLIRVRVRETVWVEQTGENAGWLGIGPDDLKSGVGVSWELDPERPSAKLVETRYWNERIDHGTASHDQAIRAMGDNPEEVRFQRDMEAMRQEPWYIQYRQREVLRELGRGDILARAAAAATASTQLPGLPPGPANGAAPAVAMGSPGLPDMGNLAAAPGGAGGPQPAPMQSLAGGQPMQSMAPAAMGLAA